MVFSYRAFFGRAREGGCLFCPERRAELKVIVYEDETILAIKNRELAGTDHWLIIPKRHVRDIENLTKADLPLLRAMDKAKDTLLEQYYPSLSPLEIHVGYHRGHRPLGGWFGNFGPPDIVSIHHLHLHVIVQPNWYWAMFKYPNWFTPMWVSNDWLMAKLGEGELVKSDTVPTGPTAHPSAISNVQANHSVAMQEHEISFPQANGF